MQTFLPFESFELSASVLDRQRLGKQRVETLQIMTALCNGTGWINHPATKMWRGYEDMLLQYQYAICHEWTSRGYKDTCLEKTIAMHGFELPSVVLKPLWLGDQEFHRAHRSNLLRKNSVFYGHLFEEDLPDDLPYIWPSDLELVR